MARQLFSVRPEDIICSARHLIGSEQVPTRHIETFPFMYWTSGRPCDLINMYFISISEQTTGASLKTYASELSHLVRYCGAKNVPFSQLHDSHMFELSTQLQNEQGIRGTDERARNNNTVRAILSRTIQFLLWYQATYILATATPLVGEPNSSPQIRIRCKTTTYGRGKRTITYWVHSSMPPTVSRDPKRPIAQPVIEAIEQTVDTLSVEQRQSEQFVRRFLTCPESLIAHLSYMRARRHFMIWLMKRTGLRPSEMVEISVKAHESILKDKRLLLPTKKRRHDVARLRSFPIKLQDANVFERYMIARNKFIEALHHAGQTTAPGDSLFLTTKGAPIKVESLQREFARLVKHAGYEDVKACFSMFRHRFITYEVIVHLKEFMDSSGKGRQLMTNSDYESILKRVATKTGHASVDSLWHYIDLAWDEINVWGGVDTAIARMHAADRLHDDLLAMKSELDAVKASKATRQIVSDISTRLEAILRSAKQHIKPTED